VCVASKLKTTTLQFPLRSNKLNLKFHVTKMKTPSSSKNDNNRNTQNHCCKATTTTATTTRAAATG